MRIAMAQLNPTIGDISGNTSRITGAITRAMQQGAELLVTPELSVIGYPPRDLLLKPNVLEQMEAAVGQIARHSRGITTLIGYAQTNPRPTGRTLYNAVAMVRDGAVIHRGVKSLLPTYDVFDESRYFEPGPKIETVMLGSHRIGLSICEDLWNDEQIVGRQLYRFNPVEVLAKAGATILVNISASPFTLGKNDFRRKLISHQAQRWNMPIVYVNQVGANDELIFDGCSMAFDAAGNLLAQGRDFEEDLVIFDLPGPAQLDCSGPRTGIASLYGALVLGLRDYARKCGFKTAVLGLSGGIDSAVVAALAAEALGRENVTGVALPSRYSSEHSQSDARKLATALGIHFHLIPIETAHQAMEATLRPLFQDSAPGLAEENLQARIRGNLLMALSNKFGHLLLTTGNKSEVATGYTTLYGDMCGGLAVISDVPKMMVYELARYINAQCKKAAMPPVIPEGSLTKAPSAELRPNQTDQDSLPLYPVLDAILQRYVEEEKSVWDIVAEGFDQQTVLRVARLVDTNEYKRKQMPPGLKVTSRAFGYGRRMPIAQRYDPAAMARQPKR
ncbi:MAG: NAD+ synthase [Planctomycetia bacterium]|nr:NAD+ synthase [Planctomycetia bacterium]